MRTDSAPQMMVAVKERSGSEHIRMCGEEEHAAAIRKMAGSPTALWLMLGLMK